MKREDALKMFGFKEGHNPTEQEIKSEFIKQARLYHPDKVSQKTKKRAEELFIERLNARDVLLDPNCSMKGKSKIKDNDLSGIYQLIKYQCYGALIEALRNANKDDLYTILNSKKHGISILRYAVLRRTAKHRLVGSGYHDTIATHDLTSSFILLAYGADIRTLSGYNLMIDVSPAILPITCSEFIEEWDKFRMGEEGRKLIESAREKISLNKYEFIMRLRHQSQYQGNLEKTDEPSEQSDVQQNNKSNKLKRQPSPKKTNNNLTVNDENQFFYGAYLLSKSRGFKKLEHNNTCSKHKKIPEKPTIQF